MKQLLLILLSLSFLASPARADDSVTSLTWNSVTGTFQALTRALGWKIVPDQQKGTVSSATLTPAGGGTATSNFQMAIDWTQTGRLFTLSGKWGMDISGTVTSVSMTLPNGAACKNGARGVSDTWAAGQLCFFVITPGSTSISVYDLGTSFTDISFNTGTGGYCAFSISCQLQ